MKTSLMWLEDERLEEVVGGAGRSEVVLLPNGKVKPGSDVALANAAEHIDTLPNFPMSFGEVPPHFN